MNNLAKLVIEFIAALLPRDDRETVLGDQAELGTSFGSALLDVTGLVALRAWSSFLLAAGTLPTRIAYAVAVVALGYWFGLNVATAE